METDYFFSKLSELIDRIESEYSRVNSMWLERSEFRDEYNLGRIRIKHYYEVNGLEEQTGDYRVFLRRNMDESAITSVSEEGFEVSHRIKTDDSIADKVNRYISNPKLQGNAPVNKCLNDLFGIRTIIQSGSPPQDVTIDRLLRMYPHLKTIDSTKIQDGRTIYLATHIYFRGEDCFKELNRMYPWELQIWSADRAEMNFKSHKENKERYVEWNQ